MPLIFSRSLIGSQEPIDNEIILTYGGLVIGPNATSTVTPTITKDGPGVVTGGSNVTFAAGTYSINLGGFSGTYSSNNGSFNVRYRENGNPESTMDSTRSGSPYITQNGTTTWSTGQRTLVSDGTDYITIQIENNFGTLNSLTGSLVLTITKTA